KYPTIRFQSTRIEKGGGGMLLATGNLTIHAVTRPTTLTVDAIAPPSKARWGATVRGATPTAKLSGKDFSRGWTKAPEAAGGEAAVGDEVQLQSDAEVVEEEKPA